MVTRLTILALLVSDLACTASMPEAPPLESAPMAKPSPPPLSVELEKELHEILADPAGAVGFGEKAWMPYELVTGWGLVRSDNPEVTTRLRLVAEDPLQTLQGRLAVLQVLGRRADAGVDPALVALLEQPELRAGVAYQLGRAGFKGYPTRKRDQTAVLTALARYLDDATPYVDPWYERHWKVQDFVVSAFVRISGPEHFVTSTSDIPELIGFEVPAFGEQTRLNLSRRSRALSGARDEQP